MLATMITLPAIITVTTLVGMAATSAQAAPRPPSTSAPVPVSAHAAKAAPAAAAKSDCPSTYFCVWVNSGYNNGPGKFGGNNDNWSNFSHSGCQSGTWNNCASSGYNHGSSGLGVEVYNGINRGGASACLPQGWSLSNFSGFVYPGTSVGFNDSISSNLWTSIC
jgi:hypothetical protein